MGYTKAGDVTLDAEEPEEQLRKAIPDGFRIINVLPDGAPRLEHEVDTGDMWVEAAEFTHPNASYEWAHDFAEQLTAGDVRVVYDWNAASSGAWFVERKVEDAE